MSPFSNSRMSPFRRNGGCGSGQGSGLDECRGSVSGGGDPGRGGEEAASGRGGGTARHRGAAGQASGSALPGAGHGRSGIGASRRTAEQRHRRRCSGEGSGTGAGTLPGLRADLRAREAGGGAWPSAVGGDAARLDDRGRAVAGEGGGRRRGGRFGCTGADRVGSAWGTRCRSTVRRTTGSRAVGRSAR